MNSDQDAKYKEIKKKLWKVGGTVELLTFIPVVGDFLGWSYEIWQSYYLHKQGFGWKNWGRLTTSIIASVAEFIPGVQEFPFIIAGVIVILFIIRLEQKTGVSISSAKDIKTHLNKNGVRAPQLNTAGPKRGGDLALNHEGIRLPDRQTNTKTLMATDDKRGGGRYSYGNPEELAKLEKDTENKNREAFTEDEQVFQE